MGCRAIALDLVGTLAQARPSARLVRPGGEHGVDAWLPESVAVWAAEAGRPVIVDLSGLPEGEQREYARCFAEAWAETGAAAEVLVHEFDNRPRMVPRGVSLAVVLVLAGALLPVEVVVPVATLAGAVLAVWLGVGLLR